MSSENPAEMVRRRRRAPEPAHHHQRRWLVLTIAGVLVGVGLVVGAPWVYANFMVREAPDPLMLTTPEVVRTVPSGPLDIDGTWEIQPGSEAGYRLNEVLYDTEVTVVGRTESVAGVVAIDDGVLVEARVAVDAGSIPTDESARDAFFRRALDTTSHPEAVFELTEPVDVSAIGLANEPLTVQAVGTLTLHGVTQPVTATLEMQRTVDGVQVLATVGLVLEDYGLSAPDLGWVVVEPAGTVEALLLLAR
jgi:polyisoprenoid-binding protein YceI